jgi:hypothetical protein
MNSLKPLDTGEEVTSDTPKTTIIFYLIFARLKTLLYGYYRIMRDESPPFSEWGGTQKRQVLKPASPPIATSL